MYIATPYPHIYIETDPTANPTYSMTVLDALNKIASKPVGRQLLDAITNGLVAPDVTHAFKVKIIRPNTTGTVGSPGVEGGSRAVAWNELSGRVGGAGCKAACYWNCNIFNTPNGARPAYIGLAHELIHCYHYVNGLAKGSYDEEEKFTVGLAPYADAAITENKIRAEQVADKIPQRDRY